MNVMGNFWRAGLALLTALSMYAYAAEEGPRQVTPLNPPQSVEADGKLEVLEFFAYGCGGCASLEPRLTEWIAKQPKDVKLKRVPVAGLIRGIDSMSIFYTLEAMGHLEKLHQKIFNAANVENVPLGNPKTWNAWLERQGVDVKKFDEMQRSFSVQTKINRARKMGEDYKIRYTPSFAVHGRHIVEQAGDAQRMFLNVEKLLAEARKKPN